MISLFFFFHSIFHASRLPLASNCTVTISLVPLAHTTEDRILALFIKDKATAVFVRACVSFYVLKNIIDFRLFCLPLCVRV